MASFDSPVRPGGDRARTYQTDDINMGPVDSPSTSFCENVRVNIPENIRVDIRENIRGPV